MDLRQADLSRGSVIGQNQLAQQVLNVKKSPSKGLKFGIAVAFVAIIALGVTLLQFNQLQKQHQMQQQENARLQAKINELRSQVAEDASQLSLISASNDSNQTKALGYIQGIQTKLKKINDYLSRRGLKEVSFKTPKEQSSEKKNGNLKLYSKYNNYLEKLISNIASVPMGYPRLSAFTSFFGYRGNPFDFGRSEFHPGIDFRGQIGDDVKCTASGRVVFTGRAGGYGNCIRIQHAGNLQTWYGHLSHINVHEGQTVAVGQVIGRVGSTGRSTGPHLHYEVRKNGHPVNPIQYLSLN